ncbi:MAG: hypothetical protein QOH47_2385 [Sphingomonadales bacterium]|jgi:hypothetical protein|nr:hypothetical protein [Sphingomonadales bacterium]
MLHDRKHVVGVAAGVAALIGCAGQPAVVYRCVDAGTGESFIAVKRNIWTPRRSNITIVDAEDGSRRIYSGSYHITCRPAEGLAR